MAEGQQSKDSGWGLVYFFAGSSIVILLIGHFYQAELVKTTLTIKLWQLKLIPIFSHHADELINQISLLLTDNKIISYGELNTILRQVNNYYIFFNLIILLPCATLLFLKQQQNFKKYFSLITLRQQEKVIWPQITPIANLQLLKEDINKGPWAMAMNPTEFCKKHNLLIAPPIPEYGEKATQITADVDQEKAKLIYAKSLGQKLRNIDQLPIHMKALFAIFAARAMEEREGPAKLLASISRSAHNIGSLDFTGAQELFDKYKNAPLIQKTIQQHAYIYTMMTSILELGRIDGVIATAEFLWLKPYDRTLWYVLNQVGRQTAWTDTAGIYAHWKAESAIKHKIDQPLIDEAVVALNEAIDDVIYKAD